MFILQGPWPSLVTRTVIPNPDFSDSDANQHAVAVKRSQSGERRTYVKRRSRRKLIWTFNMDREKALELRAFVRLYSAEQLLVTDHNGVQWLGYITNNPISFEPRRRALSGPNQISGVRQETETTTIEFQGTRR